MPAVPSEETSLPSFEGARQVVEEHLCYLHPTQTECVHLLNASGRVLAETIVADRDFPAFPRSTRDGYAVRSSNSLSREPLRIVVEVKAGGALQTVTPLLSGEAVAIMTGAPVPPGADAVVMIEYTSRHGDSLEIRKAVASGENIVPTGAEATKGDTLIHRGARIDYVAIAVAAAVGRTQLSVFRRPRIAVLATGDELVDVSCAPAAHQIRNSNGYSLAAQIQACGAAAVLLPIAPDEGPRLRDLIAQGLEADLLLVAGGVSMGKFDLVEGVLAEFDAEFLFTGALLQPGRPVVFGRIPGLSDAANSYKYFFGLPGNPLSTMVTFELFARPVVEALGGAQPRPLIFGRARLKADIRTKLGLKRFLPGLLSGRFENAEVELIKWHGSGDIAAMAAANCYVVVAADRDSIAAGEWVPIMMR
ncbi:MAG: molybdopterin molybdotransferase MoeA [Acidobacteriales bacterium]|nr:molybdopterin molybdotransferase MoeA [Terriglobales bacterium]